MFRSTFLKTNEIPTSTDFRFQHSIMPTNRSNETSSIVTQSSTTKPMNKSNTRNNLRTKRNLRDKRRATGIRPDEVVLASTSTEGSTNEDVDDEENTTTHVSASNELLDHNRTIPPSTSVYTVNRVQSSFENLSIPRTDSHKTTTLSNIYPNSTTKVCRPEEFILRRQPSDDDSLTLKDRQLEERIVTLESIIYDKDSIIHDLQRKLDNMTRDLADAQQQICILHQEKLTLIKAFTTLQDNRPSSGDTSIRSNFLPRN